MASRANYYHETTDDYADDLWPCAAEDDRAGEPWPLRKANRERRRRDVTPRCKEPAPTHARRYATWADIRARADTRRATGDRGVPLPPLPCVRRADARRGPSPQPLPGVFALAARR